MMASVAEIEQAMVTLAELMQTSDHGAAMAPIFDRLDAERARICAQQDTVYRAAAFLAQRSA